jgi:Na+/H+ antiporter NhaD/arsenite permease-like protein
MDPVQITALVIFLIAVGFIIWGKIDRAIIGIIGAALMILTGVISEQDAFLSVDWNVIAILFGIWVIAGYFGKTGIPEFFTIHLLKLSRNNIGLFIVLLGILAGFLSMFVDNVVVILIMAPVVFHLTRQIKLPSFPFIIYLGLCSNFMGTALLLGDLPPQMLHSVSGIEFFDFIWQAGRPSSFIILMITFLLTGVIFYQFKFKKMFSKGTINNEALAELTAINPSQYIKNKKFAFIVVTVFVATILAMSFRQFLGFHLGFIAISGMILLALILEPCRKRLDCPRFEDVIDETDMRTLFFYVTLFALVGSIDHVGIIEMIANAMIPYMQDNLLMSTSIIYWVTAPIVGIVEHDAYILSMLYLIRDFAVSSNMDPWPLWWAVLWAGTLGSNLTVAGAPALFVAQNLCEKEECQQVGLRQFFSYTVPFVVITLVICYILMLAFWVFPYMS